MLSLILAESALELVPRAMQSHRSVTAHAGRLRRRPGGILLDVSWHYPAMRAAAGAERRGRPDIVHACLLSACGTPLYLGGGLRIYVHTASGKTISVGGGIRLPKSYHRFEGLMSRLLLDGSVRCGDAEMRVRDLDFAGILDEIRPDVTLGLSTLGERIRLPDLASRLGGDSCVVVGGFQRGHFSPGVGGAVDGLYRIDETPLEAHVVTSRLLYEYEKTVFM